MMNDLTLFPAGKGSLVVVENGQAVTTSLQIAEVFQKEHSKVLKAIRALDCSHKLREANFGLSFYVRELPNGGHKKEPIYYIGKDGFVFLAMGFTGKIAAKFKEEYINAFNEMEEMLRKSKETQYAEKLLDEEVARFNKEMRQYVRRKQMDGRRYFGGAGELRPGFFYRPEQGDFRQKLDSLFNQMRSAYADGFSFVEQMHESRRRLDAVERSVQDFIKGVKDNVTLF